MTVIPGSPGFAYDWDGDVDPEMVLLEEPINDPEWEAEMERVNAGPITAAARLAAEWNEELHPRAGGKFTSGGDAIQKQVDDTAAKNAAVLERLATEKDYGHADTETQPGSFTRWGKTTDMAAAENAHYEAAKVVGPDVETSVAQWSYGGGVEGWRERYDNYRQTGEAHMNPRAHESILSERTSLYKDTIDRGTQQFFGMIDANRVDADLYRGQVSRNTERIESLKPGAVLPDGIASWSRDPVVAEVFREQNAHYNEGRTAAMIEMHLSPGAHGVDIAALGQTEYAWQKEVVVGGPLRVKSVDVVDEYPMTRYTVEVEPAT